MVYLHFILHIPIRAFWCQEFLSLEIEIDESMNLINEYNDFLSPWKYKQNIF